MALVPLCCTDLLCSGRELAVSLVVFFFLHDSREFAFMTHIWKKSWGGRNITSHHQLYCTEGCLIFVLHFARFLVLLVVFLQRFWMQICLSIAHFSRIFLGRMLPADTPLPWLSVFEVGHGWMKGRSTRSYSLFVALILGGSQRTNSFCSPIDLSSK